MTKKARIDSIKVERIEDCNPDLSYYNEEKDKERLQGYGKGFWYIMGIQAKAEVSYSIGNGSRRIEWFTSGGLWGIESDCGEDILKQIEKEEILDLKGHLEIFNVDMDNFDLWERLVLNDCRR